MNASESLTEIELAARWSISRRTLQRWRKLRRGPAYIRIGRITYAIDDVLAFERASRMEASCLPDRLETKP